MSEDKKERLQNRYVEALIEGFDIGDLVEIAKREMIRDLEPCTLAELQEQVSEYFPELLEGEL